MTPKLQKLYLNAGQMKAGTTYLYKLLQQHKEIYFSPEKEIHYLSQKYGRFRILSDAVRLRKGRSFMEMASRLNRPIEDCRKNAQWIADYLRSPATENWYEDMFKGHQCGQWVADFSNLTCTIPVTGLREVADLATEVRVTYCIRDAVSRAFSHAKFHLEFAGKEHDLAALPEATLRNLLSSDNIYPQSRSEDHIMALHKVFGDERLRIIRSESLWANPRLVTDALCAFLEIQAIPGKITQKPINVGPQSGKTAQVTQVLESMFSELNDRHEALLERHHRIVIG